MKSLLMLWSRKPLKGKILRSVTILTMLVGGLSVAAWIIASARQPESFQQSQTDKTKRKTLREIGLEREIETEVSGLETNAEYGDLRSLARDATVIVIGRIIDEASSFSGDDHISTSYNLEVQRVLKDKSSDVIPILQLLGDPQVPSPLSTPLKFVREGGVVYVDDHRVSTKLKGSEALKPGKGSYILFLHWSRDFKAYYLAGGASGAILVGTDLRVKLLGSEKGLTKYNGAHLESVIEELLAAN